MTEPLRAATAADLCAIQLDRADHIQPVPQDWLWPDWLSRGKLHLLAGRPGCGKTTLALALGAIVTRGGTWPDGSRAPTGDLVIWSGEDDPADTLVPRLMAAGADLGRCHFISGVRDDEGVRPFDPARDVQELVIALAALRPAMLLIDPIVQAVAADGHKNGEVRRALAPLVELAASIGCCLVGITHLSKGTAGRDPTERVTGSLAFAALARVVLLASKREAQDSDEGPPRLLVRSKSNIGSDEGGIGYDLAQVEVARGVFGSKVEWLGAVEGSARELLAQAEAAPGDDERGALADAVDFLRDLLADGPVPAKALKADADGAGHNWATVRRAQKVLSVESYREGFGKAGAWFWRLPPSQRCSESVKGAQQKTVSNIADPEHLRADSDGWEDL